MYDLALSCAKGTMTNDKKKENETSINEKKKILLKNFFFDIPFDQ
jgi:hypothetical protein